MTGKLKMHMDLSPLKRLQRKSPEKFRKAMEKGVIAFINWCNLGSGTCTRKPPIRWGVLRGSSSGFVGSKLVFTYPQIITPGGLEKPTPAISHSAKGTVMTFAWNTDYAYKMHEWGKNPNEGWGEKTKQDLDAGNQWLLMHLQKDRNDLMKVIAKEFKL